MITPLPTYRFPTMPEALACLAVRATVLAGRLGVALETWEEDGLGPAVGFVGRSAAGHVYLVAEHAHAVTHPGSRGPTVSADATALRDVGLVVLLGDMQAALELEAAEIEWTQPPTAVPEITAWLARIGNFRAAS